MICVICKEDIGVQANGWQHGHNAEPVEDGRCCSDCNQTAVIPARIEEMIVARRQDGIIRLKQSIIRKVGETDEQ